MTEEEDMIAARITRWVAVGAAALAVVIAAPAAPAERHVTLPPDRVDRIGVAPADRPVVLPPDRADGLGSARLPTMPAPVVIVRTVSNGGFDWLAAGVGAAVALALVLVGAAMRLARTHEAAPARQS